ncbi:MAG: hypothetical protein ACJ8AT_14780, partial [Hyalangium sp.]
MKGYEEWNRSDELWVALYFAANPVASSDTGLEAVLEVIEHEAGLLMPEQVAGKRRYRYTRRRAHEELARNTSQDYSWLLLERNTKPEVLWHLSFGGNGPGLYLRFTSSPLSFFRQDEAAEARCQQVVRVVRALCQRLGPVDYGFAHSRADELLGSDPHKSKPSAPPGAYEAYWLNVYGKQLVDSLGRQRVLTLPAQSVEPLPCGGVLWLSRPTVADFDSPEARRAQARCLVHLRPELRLEEVERTLLERSLAFQPLEERFDPDIADLIELILQEQTDLSS